MCKCLCCYKELEQGQADFHPSCARRMFGMTTALQMDYTREDMDGLAADIIRSQTTLTGVQAKLSLNLTKHDCTKRLTIVGLWGQYIFKPQTDVYEQLPEVEDLTMHLAEDAKLPVARHSLIRLADGSLGYITKRFDRDAKGSKIAMEDMCQLSERKTEDKYKSSYEQIAKTIARYSSVPRLDLTNCFELLLFCWITGNNDMHLKNFSLYCPKSQYVLAPAYDLVNAVLVNPQDKEELALTLNGKKSRLNLQDFIQAAERMGLTERFVEQTVERFNTFLPLWRQTISRSFLTDELKQGYVEMLGERLQRLRG